MFEQPRGTTLFEGLEPSKSTQADTFVVGPPKPTGEGRLKTSTAKTGHGIIPPHVPSLLRVLMRYPGSGGGGGRDVVESGGDIRSGRGFLERRRNVASRWSTVCLLDGTSRRVDPLAEETRFERDDFSLNRITPTRPRVRNPNNPIQPRILSFQTEKRGPPDT